MGSGASAKKDGTQPEVSEEAAANITEAMGKNKPSIPSKAAVNSVSKIVGRTTAESPLTSPLTETPCVFYTVTVQEWRKQNDGAKKSRGREFTEKYRDLFTKTQSCNFELTDNSDGSCFVNCRPNTVSGLGFASEETSERGQEPSDAFKKLMEEHNEKLTTMVGCARKLKVVEQVIGVGEVAAAVGMVVPGAGEGKVQLEPVRSENLTPDVGQKAWSKLMKPGASSILVRDEAGLAGMLSE